MKGYNTEQGYMGWWQGEYVLFASEADYYVKENLFYINGDKSLLREGFPEAWGEGETHQGTGQ